ncbi:hypothetical protein VTH06DRAFT_7552 [Thermothelomyces fergusii]
MKWLESFYERQWEGRCAERFARVRPYLPLINFITLHYAYFILPGLFFAPVFWGSRSSSSAQIGFLDSLFLIMSALTSTGLGTQNLSQMSLGQQIERGFFHLTLKEREYRGSVEYREIEVLVITIAMYSVLWQVLGGLALRAWMVASPPEIRAEDGQNVRWTGIILAVSAFSKTGMSLLDASMVAFQSGYYFVVLVGAVLMLVGSQASPIFPRLIIWACSHLLRPVTDNPNHAVWKETFEFILHYPRRVYINMLPARPTWMMCLLVGAFLIVDWIMFFLLNTENRRSRKSRRLGSWTASFSQCTHRPACFLVTVMETSHTLEEPAAFSLFNILFEVVSRCAINGISTGLPAASYSFSGCWHAGSKLVLILAMLHGRHRGLPVALDRAVKLSSMDLDDKEAEDA